MSESKRTQEKISRRTLLKGAGALGVGGLLAACAAPPAPAPSTGNSQQISATQAPAEAPAAAGAQKIVWYMNIDETRNNWAKNSIIPAFQKDNPDLTLELMTVPWEEHDTKLFAMNAAGTSPDVFPQWGQSGVGTYYHKGILRELDDLAKESKWDLSNIPDVLKKSYTFDGKLYGVPMYSLGSFIYYNKDMFDKAGVPTPPTDWNDKTWTWDEMVARAAKLTKNADDPTKATYGIQISLNDLYSGVPWLFGADIFPAEAYAAGKLSKVDLATTEMIEAVQAKADLTYKHKVAPSPSASDAISQAGNPLATGKVAMVLNGGWGIWELAALKDVQWGVAALPIAKRHLIPTFSDPWYISKGSKVPQQAFKLVQYLITGPGQRSIALELAAPPADQTLLPEWYKKFPNVPANELEQVYKGALENAKETPASLLYGYIQVEDVYNQKTAPVWNGEKSAADIMPEVDKAANEALKKI
jgi:multiple sugar transport system substrate-binding protein